MTPVFPATRSVAVRNYLALSPLIPESMQPPFHTSRASHRSGRRWSQVALRQLEPGETIVPGAPGAAGGTSLYVRELIPRGHKLAIRRISAGSPVRKYGLADRPGEA